MTETSPVSSDGFPVSASTELKQKNVTEAFAKKNEEILKKMEEETEKDENDIFGEELESQVEQMSSKGLGSAIMQMTVCPCCKEYYMGNVMQCVNGHSLCEMCREQLRECPVCKTKYGGSKLRNLTVENLLTQLNVTVDCAYKKMGCEQRIPYSKIHDHWRKCKFRPIECFYGTACGFKAKDLPDYAEHMMGVHGAFPTDTPDMEFFQLNIPAIASQLSSSRQGVTYIHRYNDDFLLVHIMNMGSQYNYSMTVHSLAKRYYIFSTTIQAPNVLYTDQQEFRVMSIETLEKLYAKASNSSQFYDFYKKKLSWFSSTLQYNKIAEMASYPTATINCMIRDPSVMELQMLTKLDEDPNVTLMENPVEEALTQEQVNSILINSGEADAVMPVVPEPGPLFYEVDVVEDGLSDDDDEETLSDDDDVETS